MCLPRRCGFCFFVQTTTDMMIRWQPHQQKVFHELLRLYLILRLMVRGLSSVERSYRKNWSQAGIYLVAIRYRHFNGMINRLYLTYIRELDLAPLMWFDEKVSQKHTRIASGIASLAASHGLRQLQLPSTCGTCMRKWTYLVMGKDALMLSLMGLRKVTDCTCTTTSCSFESL